MELFLFREVFFLLNGFINLRKSNFKVIEKVIERMYSTSLGIQTLIDESMIDICKEKGVSPEQIFLLFFDVCSIVMGYLNISFCGSQERKNVEFFDSRILRV